MFLHNSKPIIITAVIMIGIDKINPSLSYQYLSRKLRNQNQVFHRKYIRINSIIINSFCELLNYLKI